MAAVKIRDYSHGVMLIANHLLGGRTVYLSGEQQWLLLGCLQQQQAAIVHSEEAATQLLASINPNDALCPVVEPYVVQLSSNGMPSHSRELLRATGPSIRYGAPATQEANHVSI
ncbi:MAG: DUF2849 domain-containing protein [Granulosicoccaceae bacterium]